MRITGAERISAIRAKVNMSIEEFCLAYGLSRRTLYRLWDEGKGPATFYVGARRMVSQKAAEAWQTAQSKTAA